MGGFVLTIKKKGPGISGPLSVRVLSSAASSPKLWSEGKHHTETIVLDYGGGSLREDRGEPLMAKLVFKGSTSKGVTERESEITICLDLLGRIESRESA